MSDNDIRIITRCFGAFEVVDSRELDKPEEPASTRGRKSANGKKAEAKTFASKIFDSHEFGYRRLTIERPLRESFQFSDERLKTLRFAPRPLGAVMQWVYETYGKDWSDCLPSTPYGQIS